MDITNPSNILQIAMWLLGVTASNMQSSQGWGPEDRDGTGPEYEYVVEIYF